MPADSGGVTYTCLLALGIGVPPVVVGVWLVYHWYLKFVPEGVWAGIGRKARVFTGIVLQVQGDWLQSPQSSSEDRERWMAGRTALAFETVIHHRCPTVSMQPADDEFVAKPERDQAVVEKPPPE